MLPLPAFRPIRSPLRRLLTVLALLGVLLTGTVARANPVPDSLTGSPSQEAGSFRLSQVRILGVPVIAVASPVVGGQGAPAADERARVIEGNLDLLYRPHENCSLGEQIGETALEGPRLNARDAFCHRDHLGLQGAPEALQVVVLNQAGGPVQLAAAVAGRSLPLPLLTVTEEDARLSGISAEQLAERWRPLLERRLRRARLLFSSQQLDARLRRSLLAFALLAGLLTLAAWLWTGSLRVIRLQIRHGAPSGGRDRRRLKLARLGSRLLTAAMLLLGVAMVAVLMLAWPGRLAQAVDVLRQPLAVLLKAGFVLLLALVLRGLVSLVLLQWAGDAPSTAAGRGRRAARSHSLLRLMHRLVDMICVALFLAWSVLGIPGIAAVPGATLLASGAVLGALALVFQSLLRDFASGLVVLLDDRYAIGDTVEIDGITGEVTDVGVLSTDLQCGDRQVLVLPNSACEKVLNHSKLLPPAEPG